jgi:hypothetical protein
MTELLIALGALAAWAGPALPSHRAGGRCMDRAPVAQLSASFFRRSRFFSMMRSATSLCFGS